MKVAVINSGSSSIKYEVFDVADGSMLVTGLVEKIGSPEGRIKQRTLRPDGRFDELTRTKPVADHQAAFALIGDVNQNDRIIADDSELMGIGHRVVHGGERFQGPVIIDDDIIAAIRELIPLAPLHNPSNLLGIEAARERFRGVPQVAVFDTAFHQTLPPLAYRYAVPDGLYHEQHVRRYGFHGTSHGYVVKAAARHLGMAPEDVNLITLHLGNGSSAAAIRGGRSIDTSMGMTPLEGLIMGTRSGDIDPSIPFYLTRRTGMKPEDVENLLNRESGLKGICGVSDMREILDRSATGNGQAELALAMFCYRIRKYIGAYYAVLGRLNAIVFTGGIGENASAVRQQACEGMEHLGIAVDEARNQAATGSVAEIQPDSGRVRVLVIKTDEEREIAEQTINTIKMAKGQAVGRAA